MTKVYFSNSYGILREIGNFDETEDEQVAIYFKMFCVTSNINNRFSVLFPNSRIVPLIVL